MARPSKYSPEVRERFVRLVQEHTAEHGSGRGRGHCPEGGLHHGKRCQLEGTVGRVGREPPIA
jgi:hypothetical protein